VDIDATTEAATYGFAVGHMAAGEWLKYTVTVAKAGAYTVRLRAANGNPAAAMLQLKLDDAPIGAVRVPSTGGGTIWQTFSTTTPPLPAGRHTVQLFVEQPATALGWLQFEPLAKTTLKASKK
jgi:hypothetical protein